MLDIFLRFPKHVFSFHRAQEVSYVTVRVHWLVAWTEGGEDGHYLRKVVAVVLNLGEFACFV